MLGLDQRVEEGAGAVVDPGKKKEGEQRQPSKEKPNSYLSRL